MNKTTEKPAPADTRKNKQLVNSLVDELTLFDDDLMSRVFDNNIEATELLLQIILNMKIKIVSVKGQNVLKSHEIDGRSITLDINAIDENGKNIDIEVQGNSEGAHTRRARYHSSMIDSKMLKKGEPFHSLKDSYVIFIYRHDKFRQNLPIYHIERYVGETRELFCDGSHIIYVNGNYKGDDSIGQLIRDFHEPNPENMYYKTLADSVRHFKENEKGRGLMGETFEKYAKIYAEEYVKEHAEEYAKKYAKEYGKKMEKNGEKRGTLNANITSVKNLMNNMQLTLEQALNALGIHGNDRALILKQLQK